MIVPEFAPAFALIAFLPITLLVFLIYRSTRAAIGLMLAGSMFLPVSPGFDFSGFPALYKSNLPYLYLLIATAIMAPTRLHGLKLGRGVDVWVMLALAGGVGTTLLNQDPLAYGVNAGVAMSNYDILTLAASTTLTIWIPLILGRAYIRSSKDLERLLVCMVVAGLVYSIFCLIEIRLSPQFHNWVYGYHQSPFVFLRRFGGFRPVVFMRHGIAVGVFMAVTLVAAATLVRARGASRNLSTRATGYLAVILVMVKSSAAIVYGLALTPAVLVLRPMRQRTVLVALLVLILSYPVSRSLGIFPTSFLVSAAELVDTNRAHSLDFRFKHEDLLLDHALERPLFGWGTFGRNRVYSKDTGRDVSVTDGYWVLTLGVRGLVGWAAIFGVVLWPVIFVCRKLREVPDRRDQFLLLGTSMSVLMFAVDWLPNGLFTNLIFFLSGGLWASARSIVGSHATRRQRSRGRGSKPRAEVPAAVPVSDRLPTPSGAIGDLMGPSSDFGS